MQMMNVDVAHLRRYGFWLFISQVNLEAVGILACKEANVLHVSSLACAPGNLNMKVMCLPENGNGAFSVRFHRKGEGLLGVGSKKLAFLGMNFPLKGVI